MSKADECVNEHYKGQVQPIEFMYDMMSAEQFQGFCLGNLIKYSSRFGKKDDKKKEAKKIYDYARWLLDSVNEDKLEVDR